MSSIFLEYNSDEQEISLPHNFQELKSFFCSAFQANTSKNYKFSYFFEEEEYSINENNFSEKIKIIQDEDIKIQVEDDNSEEDDMKKSVTFNKYKKDELDKQNDDTESKNIIVLNKQENDDEHSKEKEEKLNDIFNNLENQVKNYTSIFKSNIEKKESDNSKDDKNIEILKIGSNSGLADSEINILDKSELKEKEKEIEELNKKIKELKDIETKKNNEVNELAKALNDEKIKNINNKKELENNLKEIQQKLEKEQNSNQEL